jgi:hypothetical protein
MVPSTSGWPGTDHDDLAATLAHPRDFDMDLGHQRARGIEHPETARLRLGAHRARDAMGAEHDRAAGRDVCQLVDEYRALRLQAVDDELVVDHFVANVDRRPELRQRLLDDRDRAVDTCAKTPGIGENDLHGDHLNATGLPVCAGIRR